MPKRLVSTQKLRVLMIRAFVAFSSSKVDKFAKMRCSDALKTPHFPDEMNANKP